MSSQKDPGVASGEIESVVIESVVIGSGMPLVGYKHRG